jgi:hypothetical protein
VSGGLFRPDWDKQRLLVGDRRYFPEYMYRQNLPDDEPKMMADPWVQQSGFRMYDRRCVIPFENMWSLSVIWGDSTHSSNYMHPLRERQPFIEDPATVEVGVCTPEEREGAVISSHLIGEPLAYVDVDSFNVVATAVMAFPTDAVRPEPDWEDVEGFVIWARLWALEFNNDLR